MSAPRSISAFVGILICINTMVGAGVFINPMPLTQLAGSFSFLSYIVAALILLPLVLSVAQLAQQHPVSGGLYVYSAEYLHPIAGFMSGWGYFVGKTTTLAILAQTIVLFLQSRFNTLQNINTLLLVACFLFSLALLHVAGLRIGGFAQHFFTTLKAIPILFAIIAGSYFFMPDYFSLADFTPTGIIATIPLGIFPLTGFEIICAIGHLLKDPEHSIKRVIIWSFLLVALSYTIFQFCLFGALGWTLAASNKPLLLLGLQVCNFHPFLAHTINSMVFAAMVGACFAVLSSNCWNLYTLAQHKHFPCDRFFTQLTHHHVPYVSVMAKATLGCLLLAISSNQIALQNMSVFGQIVSHLLSACAAFAAVHQTAKHASNKIIPLLGICSGLFVLSLCLHKIFASGVSFSFLAIFALGLLSSIIRKQKTR
ncbi:MAG: amino acid permease [Epsilonproteobacteria bacterium]|nr:amino acid permease [Campylobacterota bacterium]